MPSLVRLTIWPEVSAVEVAEKRTAGVELPITADHGNAGNVHDGTTGRPRVAFDP